MYGKNQQEFAQFFEEVEEIPHTPSRTTSRVVMSNTPKTRTAAEPVAMTPRMEIMLRKEKKAREDAAQLTFRPHVNRKGNGSSPSSATLSGKDSANRFDALYSDALKRHLEGKWKESADQKELTFTPKITERGRSRASSRNGSRVGSRASSREREGGATVTPNSIDRLHSTQKGNLKHGVDPDNKLTFKPEITKRAMSIDRKETAKRLYTPNSIEKERTKAAIREIEIRERELENCTFSPQLYQSTKYAPKEKVDIRERMARFEEMKKQRQLERQQQQLEQEKADASFKPALMAKPKRAPTPTKPFHERLAQPFERSVPAEMEKEINASMTFKPTLVSKRAASPNGRASEYSSVHERLYKEGEQRKRETQLALEALKIEAETNFTFSPEINSHSKATPVDAGPVFERLATSTSKQYMQEVLMKVKTEMELKDCTFHPKLSTEGHKYVPKEGIDPNAPVHERLNQEAELKRLEKERLDQLRIENSLKHHTFTPQIPESSKSMISSRGSFIGSPDGGGNQSVSGSVSGGDDIFARLNAQSTIAKSPHLVDPNLQNKSPTKTRSMILTEQEHAKLYERLSATPKSLSFAGNLGASRDDDSSSVNNRRSAAEIDDVVNRLHTLHTKAKKAPAFEDPQPLHAILRSNSISNGNTPSGSPDKSLSRRGSMDGASMLSGSPQPAPKRMMSMSLSMSPPPSLQRKGSMSLSPTASAPTPLARSNSISGATPKGSSPAAPALKKVPSKASNSSNADAPPEPPKVVPRKPSQSTNVVPPPAPAAVPASVAPVSVPSTKQAPPAQKASVAAAPPLVTRAPVKQASSSAKPSAGGDDFLSKIEASMNMLSMNPAQVVASQMGTASPAPAPTLAPTLAPASVPVPAEAPSVPVADVAVVEPISEDVTETAEEGEHGEEEMEEEAEVETRENEEPGGQEQGAGDEEEHELDEEDDE